MPLLLLFYLFQILKNLIRNTADTTTARQIPFLKDQEIQTHHGQPYFNYTTQYCFGFQIRSLSKNKPHGTLPWHSMLWDVHFFFFLRPAIFFFFLRPAFLHLGCVTVETCRPVAASPALSILTGPPECYPCHWKEDKWHTALSPDCWFNPEPYLVLC